MIVVRHDTVGKAELKLLRRPTNTCVGVDNWHFYAASTDGPLSIPIVRFFGTDGQSAEFAYNQAVLYAHQISESL